MYSITDLVNPLSQAASLMGRRSVDARVKAWGKQEFEQRMREWGKLGGRPKKSIEQDQTKSEAAKETH
jgi:hypothetical protein